MLRASYVALALADSWAAGGRSHSARRSRRVTKPLLMPTLSLSLLTDPRATTSPLRRSTLAAQDGGWAGDVALLGDGRRSFLTGVGAFAVGHLASLSGLHAVRGPGALRSTSAARTAAAVWLATAPLLTYAAARRDRVLIAPVLSYAALLALLAARAAHLDPALPRDARRCAAAGAWTFLLSDTLLATRSFVLDESPPALDRAVMLTYTAAQLLLAEAAARSRAWTCGWGGAGVAPPHRFPRASTRVEEVVARHAGPWRTGR
ncbi:lysoplasmalogenase family protein [Nocardioides aurantiacus]|uniref:lysoplasmalogenase family protein n=1 Tax=Nocardioides aurantiacus TaxID=86796 RepID=UPI00403F7E1D